MPHAKRNKYVAALFAVFGGVIGLHKFYLKEFSGGIFYLFLFFMSIRIMSYPLTSLLGFFEAFKYLTMSNDDFDRKYNNVPQNSPYRKGTRRRSTRQRQTERENVQQRTAKRHNPFIKSGARFYKEYELEEAAKDYAKALEIDPHNKEVLFNSAAIHSLLENTDKSMEMLQRLIKAGYNNFEKIEKHDDLAFLRIQPEFESFKANGYKSTAQAQIPAEQKDDLLQDDVLLSQLNKLMELRKKGFLNEAEFALERKKLMQRR